MGRGSQFKLQIESGCNPLFVDLCRFETYGYITKESKATVLTDRVASFLLL